MLIIGSRAYLSALYFLAMATCFTCRLFLKIALFNTIETYKVVSLGHSVLCIVCNPELPDLLVMVKLFSKNSNLCDHNPPTSQTDRKTDRQTDDMRLQDRALQCTKVHRAVTAQCTQQITFTHLINETLDFVVQK